MNGLIALVSLAVGVAAPLWNSLVDGSQLGRHGVYDQIPERSGERVLLNEHGVPVLGLAMVIDLSYSTVVNQLLLGSPWVEKLHVEKVELVAVVQPVVGYAQDSSAALRAEAERLRAAGINATRVPEHRFTFKPFNVNEPTREYSTLTVSVADALPIFGANCSLATITRVDRTKVPLRTFHLGIPLPKRGHSEVTIVTDTELKLLQAVDERLGRKVIGAVPSMTGRLGPYGSSSVMLRLSELAARCSGPR